MYDLIPMPTVTASRVLTKPVSVALARALANRSNLPVRAKTSLPEFKTLTPSVAFDTWIGVAHLNLLQQGPPAPIKPPKPRCAAYKGFGVSQSPIRFANRTAKPSILRLSARTRAMPSSSSTMRIRF